MYIGQTGRPVPAMDARENTVPGMEYKMDLQLQWYLTPEDES
jgi:hypothetical protein